MTLLSVQNVTQRFGGVTAVSDVSLDIDDHSLLGFIGPNGAGKTTLMRIITGVLRPQQGRVLFHGQDISRWTVNRRVSAGIALSQQIVKPLYSLTLLDNVALAVGAKITGSPLKALTHISRVEQRARAQELLDVVGIGDSSTALPNELPLGMLKRLELVRALALDPALLLLDEPLAGLNQAEARKMADLIASLVTSKRSVLLIEHNIREVARICPRIYVQDNGKRLLFGSTDEVMASAELRNAYLGQGSA